MRPSDVTAGAPSLTRHTSNDVPPMSTVRKSRAPCGARYASAAVGAAAGPDSSVVAAAVRATAGAATPPLDCMTSSTPRKPAAPRRVMRRSR